VASRDEIIAYANDYLDLDAYPDYGPMGLQVVGAAEVSKLACGVSASLELFERAAAAGAQLLLVHHGLFWDRDPRAIDSAMRGRLEALFRADLNLAAYHLALDAHPSLGNNALLARAVGVSPDERFIDVGFGGRLEQPCSIEELTGRVERALERPPLVFASGPPTIERMAICSGAAAGYLRQAADEGYDCYLTGEPSEPAMAIAAERGIHFVAAGHYATEIAGVRALAAHLGDRFALDWEFLELRNPV
jgi:dinuclear metal center YbgI/SA1388 family protein